MNKNRVKGLQIEVGSSFITAYSSKDELILKEPSLVLVDKNTKKVIAVGREAEEKLGNLSGNIDVIKPLKYGFFVDQDIAKEMFSYIINKSNINKVFKPKIIIYRPNNSNNYYDNVFYNICDQVGIRKIKFSDSLLFSARRLKIKMNENKINMIVDVGACITKIGIIFKGEVIKYNYLNIASDKFDDAIIKYIKDKFELIISMKMAEDIKTKIGNVYINSDVFEYEVRARHMDTGIPKTVVINSKQLYEILNNIAMNIVNKIKEILIELSNESIEDLIDNGIYLIGGGSKIKGLNELMKKEINLKIINL